MIAAAALVAIAFVAVAHFFRSMGAERAELRAGQDQLHRELVELTSAISDEVKTIEQLQDLADKLRRRVDTHHEDLMQLFEETKIKRKRL